MKIHKPYVFAQLIAAFSIALLFSTAVVACTIGESMETALPFNDTELSNADRINIANIVVEARKWPDVEIQAVIIAGAYAGEKNIERLKDIRGENAKSYLMQLGIKKKNILIDRKTLTDEMVRNDDGTLSIHQVVIELTPICSGGCERLCDDPRVTPTTKAIK